MATLEQIIKDLQSIVDSGAGGTGGGASQAQRKAAAESKRLLQLANKINKTDEESLRKKNQLLSQASGQLRLGDKERDQIEERIKVNEDLIESQKNYKDTLKDVGSSFIGLGKAAFEGSGSISAFTDNIVGLKLIGQRLDVNVETFRQLSQTGANFGKSIVDLRNAAFEAALPLDDFASLVANNSQNLAALFGSTTQGAQAIATLGRRTRELGIDQLAPLGFTVEEINETLLLNLDNQRRAGVLNQLSDSQRIKSSIAFAEQLDRLAKLTGQQRDELRSQIEQQQSNERFQAFLQGQTVETGNRLRAFAGTVAGISPELAEGFQDLIANAGVPVTESALALVQNIPGARGVIQDLINGVISSEQALVQIRDISAGSIDKFRNATVTGQVEFLRLQGGIIELGRRVTDTGAVFDEQSKSATDLVQGLTTFENASKVLASEFQSIETELLKAFGPMLGGAITKIQDLFGSAGALTTAIKENARSVAILLAGALAGKFLFNKAVQTGIIGAGTRLGTGHISAAIYKTAAMRGGGGVMGKVGGIAGKALRIGGGIGAGIGAVGAVGDLMDDDKSNNSGAVGTLIGTGLGFMVGGPIGAMLGGMAGNFLGNTFGGGRQFGGPGYAGKMYLTGEKGPELFKPDTDGEFVSNAMMRKTADMTSSLDNSFIMKMIEESKTTNTLLGKLDNQLNNLNGTSLEQLKGTIKLTRRTAEGGNIIVA